MRARTDLERLLKRDVDVVILNTADPFLRQQVYTKGKLIFVRNKKEAEDLKWRHIREYWDYIPIKRMMENTAIQELKKYCPWTKNL